MGGYGLLPPKRWLVLEFELAFITGAPQPHAKQPGSRPQRLPKAADALTRLFSHVSNIGLYREKENPSGRIGIVGMQYIGKLSI